MDGNGRWAAARGKPRLEGHRVGAQALRRTVEAAPKLGITVLTVYAFSSDNWKRPPQEISGLLRLFQTYLARETANCVRHGIRLSVVGRRDRLPPRIRAAVHNAEHATRDGAALHLRLAIDYSARDNILRAVQRLRGPGEVTREDFARALAEGAERGEAVPDVDLLIRTGGEQRLSDFLLWECAYAEFSFLRAMWPDFGEAELAAAVADFHRRERRFGCLPVAQAG